MKLERELLIFAETLNSDVRDRATGSDLSGNIDFRENAFTEVVVEHLFAVGMVENGEVCHCEARVGRGIGKVSGFGFNDDEDTLEVFASIFLDSRTPETVPSDDIRRGAERAVRFVEGCFGGIHENMEVASGRVFDGVQDPRTKGKTG